MILGINSFLVANKDLIYLVSHDQMKNQVKHYFFEAKWYHQNYIPTVDEYMTVALISSGHPNLSTISFVGMGDIVTKESFEWLFSNPRSIRASCAVGRLMNDMASHKVNIQNILCHCHH